jgi:hypothetical protein
MSICKWISTKIICFRSRSAFARPEPHPGYDGTWRINHQGKPIHPGLSRLTAEFLVFSRLWPDLHIENAVFSDNFSKI